MIAQDSHELQLIGVASSQAYQQLSHFVRKESIKVVVHPERDACSRQPEIGKLLDGHTGAGARGCTVRYR